MLSKNKQNRIKKTGVVLLLLTLSFILYVMIENRNSKNMTLRQKILRAVYPVFMLMVKGSRTNSKVLENNEIVPIVPFYTLPAILNDGKSLNLHDFKGKKILLVNTASDCGYTGQFEALEKLYQEHKENLVVLGFPANDFKEQEKGSDENIAAFCKINYGVSFPLLSKSKVIKGNGQNEIFKWLTHKDKNGWNEQAPSWNFCKYLINENGMLINYFAPGIEPMSGEVLKAVSEKH